MKNLDLAWWLYFATCVVSWYGVLLFAWWWSKTQRATAVYLYVMFLLLGIALSTTGSIYARWYLSIDYDLYKGILSSWWWAARLWITLGSVIAIVGHMSYRVFWQRHKDDS